MFRLARVALILLALSVVLAGGAGFLALRKLPSLAEWALERTLPGITADIESATITFPNQLHIRALVLKSRQNGETLLTLNGGSLSFDFSGLRQRQIREIRLVEPVLSISPRFGEALIPAPTPTSPPSTTPGTPWSVGRLVCDYGELNISKFGSKDLLLQSKFACDFQDFSPTDPTDTEHSVVLWNFSATKGTAPTFLTLDVLHVTFSFADLLNRHTITSGSLEGGSLLFGHSLRELFVSSDSDPASPPKTTANTNPPDSEPWMVDTLDIQNVNVRIDDEQPDVTDITFALNTTLRKLPLTQTASTLGAENQIVEIANIDILSPYDPLTKVFTIDRIYLHFTLAGLLNNQIADLTISGPTIHVGQDLFWYMENIQKRLGLSPTADSGTTSVPAASAAPGWTVDRLFIHNGQLVVGSGGHRHYGLPLGFWANAQDIALDNLASLKAQTTLEIPPQKYVFDSYQLEFTSEKGTLKFSYPPEKNEKNLVGDITLADIRWRQYHASDAYVSVTFDQKGINGIFGGKLYRGEAGGGFSFFFDPTSPWIGWLYGIKIDLKRLTNIVSPQNFQMTGPLTFKLQIDAEGKSIDRIVGDMAVPKPGKLTITKLDALLADIPPAWTALKQDSTRIALEALRDFEYHSGAGDFWFVRSQGIFQLKLQGEQGSRSFDVVLHSDDSPEGRWKQIPATP